MEVVFKYLTAAMSAEGKTEPKQYAGKLMSCWPVKGDRKFLIITENGERNMLESRIDKSDSLAMSLNLDKVYDASPKVLTLDGMFPLNSLTSHLPVASGSILDKRLEDLVIGAIDLETTGLYPWGKGKNGEACEPDRITEFGIVHGGIAGATMEYSTFLYPDRGIPQVVTDLTGMVDATVAMAPTFEFMRHHISSLIGTCDVVVAHHAPFEQGFLASEFQRAGWHAPNTIMLDTKVMAKKKGGFINHKQTTVSAALGIEYVGDAHRAIPDAQVCMKLVRIFIGECIAQGDVTLGDLVKRYAE